MDDSNGSFLEWLITGLIIRVFNYLINRHRGCAITFYALLVLPFLVVITVCLVGVLHGQQGGEIIAIAGCSLFAALFGWLLYRTITSPTWPPRGGV